MRNRILNLAKITSGPFIFFMIITVCGSAHADPTESPVIIEKQIRYIVRSETIRVVTAYNAGDPAQTDDSPCIAANGENICKALEKGKKRCAANFVPLGSSLYVDKIGVCLVTDRTNKRYRNRVDIAMKKNEYQKARRFGRQKLKVKIIDISHEPHYNHNLYIEKSFKTVTRNPAKVKEVNVNLSKVGFEGGVLTGPSTANFSVASSGSKDSGSNKPVEIDSTSGLSVITHQPPSSTSFEAIRPSAMF
jgi:3D (Asp-Asp-Asp) domain-containing protein